MGATFPVLSSSKSERADAPEDTNADGPALRASAMTQYAEWLLETGNSSYVERSLWPVIQLDLDYVATYRRQSTSVHFPHPPLF